MPRALVIGCSGQDGTLLCEFLAAKGYDVFGVARNAKPADSHRVFSLDVRDASAIRRLVGEVLPDELYYLAAFHHSSEQPIDQDNDAIAKSLEVNTLPLSVLLQSLACLNKKCRLFYAASSRVFGLPLSTPQDELTPMNPICPYGISKTAAIHLARFYRSNESTYCSVGILYNHESRLRPHHFLSRKLIRSAVRIKKGLQETVTVGNLDAATDWGYAPDYVSAMWHVLQADEPNEFIVATGRQHTVRHFASIAFDAVGLAWERHVIEDRTSIRLRNGTNLMVGNPGKIIAQTGWRPQVSFEEMVHTMMRDEMGSSEYLS